jgi:hypothetical protein
LNIFVLILSAFAALLFAGPWPGQLPGAEIGSGLPAGYEPSGVVWHTVLNKLLTVWDNGTVSMMDYDGTDITNWSVSGDLEAVCIADPTTDFVYIGLERPDDGIKELNINTGQVTRFFNLTPWMQSQEPNAGLEALTFVPDTSHPEGGLFYAGMQENGTIYIFELPIKSSSTDSTVTFVDSLSVRFLGISGLDYDPVSDHLYALSAYSGTMRVTERDGTIIATYYLPGDSQEGVALWEGSGPGERQVFVAEDNGEVWRYDFNSVLGMTIAGNGSVTLEPDPPSYYGTNDTLTAIPAPGYRFIEWIGDLTSTDNPAALLMDYDKNVTAIFTVIGINETRGHAVNSVVSVAPNPFSKLTTINFEVDSRQKTEVSVQIYNISGCCVKSFGPLLSAPGPVFIRWDGTDADGVKLPCGIYFIELVTGKRNFIKNVTLLR